ncbi:MAG: hypothetical protein EOP04_22270, partial [Proteobacteria bacterium]
MFKINRFRSISLVLGLVSTPVVKANIEEVYVEPQLTHEEVIKEVCEGEYFVGNDSGVDCSYVTDALKKKLDLSLKAWKQFKNNRPMSCVYDETQYSWSGYKSWMQAIVFDDKLARRSFASFMRDDFGELSQVTSWVEDSPEEFGTHGRSLATLEDYYSACAKFIDRRDPREEFIGVSTDERGVLSGCT